MKQLRQTLVRHLEHVFTPPGLPLVSKAPSAVPTTSIVVRGKAGSGKTTLAVALALTVARANEGRVFYLSTETTTADARTKADQLGVAAEAVAAWDQATADHELLLDHLAVQVDVDIESPEDRAESALALAWQRLQLDLEGPPVRALVIDAFALVGLDAPKSMRAEVMSFLTAVEGKGISVVLVEEAPPPERDWLGFLADLIFETGWGTDPDTGEWFRTLTCVKSRYVLARPGPHDYGRQDNELVAWPALLPIALAEQVEAHASPWLVVGDPPAPMAPGSLIAEAPSDTTHGFLTNLISFVPWISRTTIYATRSSLHRAIWSIVDEQQSQIVLVMGASAAFKRSQLSARLDQCLQALALLGITAVVQLDSANDVASSYFTHTEYRSWGVIDSALERSAIPRSRWLNEQVSEGAWKLWEDSEGVNLSHAVSNLQGTVAERWAQLLFAMENALRVRSELALNWLVAECDTDDGEVARHLAVAPLVEHRRFDDARALIAKLDHIDEEERARLNAEIDRRAAEPPETTEEE